MADNVELNLGVGGAFVASDEINGAQHQLIKIEFGAEGQATQVSEGNPLPITGTIATKEKPDATATFSPTNSTSIAYENSRVAKASAGTLYSITGYNSKAISQFIQIHNALLVPLDGAIPEVIFVVPGLSNFSYSSDKFGRFFSNGIVVCNSSTGPTKTIGLADVWFDIQSF